jgi:molybdenum cofactor cytidylyltransferase
MQPQIAAIILAAGKSARMGQAKQLLRLGDTTVLGQTLANVRRAALDEIILVLGASAEAIRRQLLAEDLKVVVNAHYEQGMAASLRAGLEAVSPQTTAVLSVLADQPLIRPATLTQLADHYRRTNPQILIPTYRGTRGNPVLLDRSLFAEAMALEGDVGCRALFAQHPETIEKLEVEDEGILLDIDNQDDYQRLTSALDDL